MILAMHNSIQKQTKRRFPQKETWLLTLVPVLLVLAISAQAQHVDIPAIRSDNFNLTMPVVRVSLRQVRTDVDRVIGIQVDNKTQQRGSIEIGDFVTTSSSDRLHLEFLNFSAVGREKLEIGNNSVAVSGLDDCQGSLFVLLTVPPETNVHISLNGKAEFVGTVTKGVMIHRGKMVGAEFFGRHQLYSRLLFPDLDEPQPEAIKTKNGYSLSQDILNKHLISFSKPPNHTDSIWGDLETVTLSIKIDTQGKVVLAKPLAGREPFLTDAVNSLAQARFKPFVVENTPVDSLGNVTIVFSKDGRVSSTLK